MGPAGPAGAGLFGNVESAQSAYAEALLADTTPVNPSIVYNGAPVSQIPVPVGTNLIITDAFWGIGFVFWTIEVDFGSGFVDLANFGFTLVAPVTTEVKKFNSPITIVGGPGVAVRLRAQAAQTPTTPIDANATLRIYTTPAGPALPATQTPTIFTLTQQQTVGSAEQILPMSENAGASGASLPVPAGTVLEIDDFDVAAGGQPGTFKLQQTNDGTNWFTIGRLDVLGIGNGAYIQVNPKTPWRIDGGANVAVRIAITTSSGDTPVASVVNGFRYT